MTVLAVDVGGTKLAAAVVDDDGLLRSRAQEPTPDGDAEQIWAALVAVCAQALRDAGSPTGVVVGAGASGPMRWPDGVIAPLNIPGWKAGFPLRARLSEQFGPTRLHNDAICAAVGEHWRGAARGTHHMLGMVVSTGVGGGLVLGGRLVDGGRGNAGHIGHVVVEPDGPPCGCGGRGCLEAVARGPAIAAAAGVATAAEAADRARGGDARSAAAFVRAGTALGRAIASVGAVCDLDIAVVGGGVARSAELLFTPARAELAVRARLDFLAELTIVPAALGGDAGLVGAAALWVAGEAYWSAG